MTDPISISALVISIISASAQIIKALDLVNLVGVLHMKHCHSACCDSDCVPGSPKKRSTSSLEPYPTQGINSEPNPGILESSSTIPNISA